MSFDTRTIGENLLTQSRAVVYLVGQLLRVFNGNAGPQLPVVTTVDLTSGMPRLDVANDRQLYIALLGPAWWLGVQLSAFYHSRPALIVTVTALMLVTLVYATSLRNRVYDTEVTFWQNTVTRNPTSARAANNLDMAYATECRLDEAATEFRRALHSTDFRASINLLLLSQASFQAPSAAFGARSDLEHANPRRNRGTASTIARLIVHFLTRSWRHFDGSQSAGALLLLLWPHGKDGSRRRGGRSQGGL